METELTRSPAVTRTVPATEEGPSTSKPQAGANAERESVMELMAPVSPVDETESSGDDAPPKKVAKLSEEKTLVKKKCLWPKRLAAIRICILSS